jgi:branched-chain amino acid transport system substrate-binding protein
LHFINFTIGLALVCASFSIMAEQTKPLIFGMSAPLTGPAKQLGLSYQSGAAKAFAEYNQTREATSPAIELQVLDDGYEPLQTVANTKQFLLEDKVFALFGYVGTPTTNSALPLLRKYRKPFIAPLTGSDLLRQPDDTFIVNFRRSYAEEIAAQFQFLVDKKGYKRIGLLIQADEFGASVERNILEQLSQRNLSPIHTARFKRNSADIFESMSKLQQFQPEFVITVGTYSVISEAILLSTEQGFTPAFSILSFTGAKQLASALKGNHQVFASAVLPWPTLSADSKYTDDIHIEGFHAASFVVAAVKACGKSVNDECLLKELNKVDGFSFKSNQHNTKGVYMLQLTKHGFELMK